MSTLPWKKLSFSSPLQGGSHRLIRVGLFNARTIRPSFSDSSSEVELRIQIGGQDVQNPRDISVDANHTSLAVRVQRPGSPITLIETNNLFDKIKPEETICYIDDDQLVVSLKKHDPGLKWPDIKESWESLLKGTNLVGDSTDINQKVARELATGLGYIYAFGILIANLQLSVHH